ncbi:MAG: acyl-CoA dehydrogenase family protein [Solirubrobacteraceae bacterium]
MAVPQPNPRIDVVPCSDGPSPLPGDVTPNALIESAQTLIPLLRDEQAQTEERGHYSWAMHERFVQAGFSRILQPRRYGGYELDLPTFARVMVAIATGCPSTGWCLGLASSHAYIVASRFGEAAQAAIFGPNGDFRCPHSVAPGGTAERAPEGWRVSGRWRYCSGIPYSTHFMGSATVHDGSEPPQLYAVVVPKEQITVLDDWHGDEVLGMRGSGSNSVAIEDAVIPEPFAVPFDWDRSGMSAGMELHGNPMYVGLRHAFYHATLVMPIVGAAKAALEEYETLLDTRKTTLPPFGQTAPVDRRLSPDYQRDYGLAVGLVDTAEELLYAATQRFMRVTRERWERGDAYTITDDARIYAILQHAGDLAARAVAHMFATGGSNAARRGERLQRYYRDVAMYRGHLSSQRLDLAGDFGRLYLGVEGPGGHFR